MKGSWLPDGLNNRDPAGQIETIRVSFSKIHTIGIPSVIKPLIDHNFKYIN